MINLSQKQRLFLAFHKYVQRSIIMTQLKGTDISDFQGQPDFDKLKEELDFVLTKATEGVGFTAWTLNRNKSEMRRVDLPHGFYHFARGGDPLAEADYFVDQI